MASVKKCKELVGENEFMLQLKIRELRRACKVVPPDKRVVAKLVDSLGKAQDNLLAALVKEQEAQLNQPIITQYPRWMNDVEEVMAVAEAIIGAEDEDGVPNHQLEGENGTPNSQVDGENLKRDHARLVLSIETQLVAFKGVMQTALTKEQHEELKEGVKELSDLLMVQLTEVYNNLRKVLPQDVGRLKEKHNEFYNQKMPELEQLKSDLRMKKPPETTRPTQDQTPWAGEGALAQEHRAVQKQMVKFKPLDHPEFDGKAKNYARFKQRFDEMITSSFDSMGQLEFLEKAIPKKVKEKMSLVSKTPEQLWKQLDDMFADPKVMLREAMDELHSVDYRKLGDDFIPVFAATLLDTEALLDANQNGDHLRHPREVVYMQNKLPKAERVEYVRREQRYQGGDFAKFKSFLMERKREEEELRKFGTGDEAMEQTSNRKKCDYCQKPGHTKEECRRYKSDLAATEGRELTCWNCNEPGHRRDQCPKLTSPAQTGTGASPQSNQESHSNHLRTADCPRCKIAGPFAFADKCAGYGKIGQGMKHCLAHCASYMEKDVAGKAKMVTNGGNCVICLHPNHAADRCYDKDKPNRVCGIDDCKSHHHPTLHGSKVPQIATCNVTRVVA